MINQTIQFLATKSDKRKFRVNTSKKIYNESDEIIIKAKLYNDNYEQVLEEKIDLELKNEQGEIFKILRALSSSIFFITLGMSFASRILDWSSFYAAKSPYFT